MTQLKPGQEEIKAAPDVLKAKMKVGQDQLKEKMKADRQDEIKTVQELQASQT